MEGVLRVTEDIASQMPDLGLPKMPEDARAAFREVLKYERPPGNGSVHDILILSQARGYCAHPGDWVPSSEGDNQFPKTYEPWAAWLAENNYTPFYEGVRLTVDNFDRWKPQARASAFRNLRREDRETANNFFLTVCARKPAAIRRKLAAEIGRHSMFSGPYPHDVPILRQLLNDRDAQIRDEAARKLELMKGLETSEDHAKAILHYFEISRKGPLSEFGETGAPEVIISPEIHEARVMRHCRSTDLDTLAGLLGVTARDFVSGFDLEHFKGEVCVLILSTIDTEARHMLARRLVEAGRECPVPLDRDADPELWQKALERKFESEYPFSIFSYLKPIVGALDITSVRKIKGYLYFVPSIQRELETGELPVNKWYDPLRFIALAASKDAATELMEEARTAGIAENNPRLTMLKLNLAL